MEGPSLVIVKEELNYLIGRKVTAADGNSKIDKTRLINRKMTDIRTFGKHLLMVFDDLTIRIHFLMFGSYRINERKETPVRLCLQFKNTELNFYSCAVSYIELPLNDVYNWSTDVMSGLWNEKKARKKLKAEPSMNIGDALLDQDIFAGVGNIIKNEVLYRTKVHPDNSVGSIPSRKLSEIIQEARNYSLEFYQWKKLFELRKHWLAYKKKKCRRCDLPLQLKHTGKNPRRTFFCENCQRLY